MDKHSTGAVVAFTVGGIMCGIMIGAVALLIVGGCIGYDMAERDAVKAGAAIWTADENGSAEFQWIVPENNQ